MDNRGIDTDVGWMNRKFRELERAIEALRSERRAGATTVSGGSLTIDGGDVIMRDTDGSIIFQLGSQAFLDRGISIFRNDGTVAFGIRKLFSNVAQTIAMYDKFGNVLVSEDSLGVGLSKPTLDVPMQPVQAVASTLTAGPNGWEVPVATTAWTTVYQANYVRQNQFGTFRTTIAASDTTTSAEVRILDVVSGTHLGGFLAGPTTGTRGVGSTAFVEVLLSGIYMQGNPGDIITTGVQVRRTAGAGTLRVALTAAHGG